MQKLTDWILSKLCVQAIDKEDFEITQYGLHILLLNIVSVIVLLFVGVVTGYVIEVIIIMGVFITFRPLIGGYHAKSFIGCLSGTVSLFLTVVLAGKYITPIIGHIGLILVMLISLIVVWLIGTVKNPLHMLEDVQYATLKRKAKRLCIIELLLCIVISVWKIPYGEFHIFAIAMVAILALFGSMRNTA